MIRPVKIRNLTDTGIPLGTRIVPARGTLTISPSEYLSIVSQNDISSLGIEVFMRDVNMKNVSVKDFGAKGDGFNDDTYAFQSAIEYVGGNGGGIVNVPVGVYIVSYVVVTNNVSICGESRKDSVLKSKDGNLDAILSIEGVNVSIKSLRIVM